MKLTYKLNVSNSKKYFLIQCRKFDLYLKHSYNTKFMFHFNNFNNNRKFKNCKNKFIQQILNIEIDDIIYQIKQIKKLHSNTLYFILNKFHLRHIEFFLYINNKFSVKQQHKLYMKHRCKFLNLNAKKHTNLENHYTEYFSHYNNSNNLYMYQRYVMLNNNQWIESLSNLTIPTNVSNILALGPKFSYNNPEITEKVIFDTIKSFESQIYKIPINNRANVRFNIVNTLKNEQKNNKFKKTHSTFGEKLFLDNLKETEKFLKDQKEIIITKADKRNKTVVLTKQMYINESNKLLIDGDTY